MAKKGKSPAMQWYPADVESDEAVKLMNNREFGCYVKLLGHNWLEGSIPKSIEILAVIVREDPRDFDGIWAKIKAKFRVKNSRFPDRLTNNRIENERMKQRAYSKKQKENAEKAHKKHKSDVDGKSSQAKPTASKWHDSGSALQSSSSVSSSSTITIPTDLLNNKEAIESWIAHKKENGYTYKVTGLKALWGRLRKIPESSRDNAIEASIAAGYKGIFEPKDGGKNGKPTGAAPRITTGFNEHII